MNVIFAQDFRAASREKRTFALRAAIAGVPVLMLALPMASRSWGPPRGADGGLVLGATAHALLAVCLLVAPALAAAVLAEERRNAKLEVLRSSPVGAAAIVLGRWSSRLLQIANLVLPGLAVCALSLIAGGVSLAAFLQAALVILATLAWTTALALLCGSRGRDVGRALLRAYAATVAVVLAPPAAAFVVALANPAFRGLGVAGPPGLTDLNPHFALEIARRGFGFSAPGVAGLALYLPGAAAGTVLCLLLAIRNLRREPTTVDRRRERQAPAWQGLRVENALPPRGHAGATAPAALARGVPREAIRRPRLLDRDPALWLERCRDRRRRPFARTAFWLLAAGDAALLVIGVVLAPYGSWKWGEILYLTTVGMGGSLLLAFLAVGSRGAAAFHHDGVANAVDVLHSTPLTNRALIAAKLRSVMLAALPWWLFSIAHYLVRFIPSDEVRAVTFFSLPVPRATVAGLVLYLVTSLVLIASFAAFSLVRSAKAPTATKAAVRIGLAFVALNVALPLLVGLFPLGGGTLLLLGYHPFVLAGAATFFGSRPESIAVVVLFLPIYLIQLFLTLRVVLPFEYRERRPDDRPLPERRPVALVAAPAEAA